MSTHSTYTTNHEKKFIDTIGSFNGSRKTKAQLLRGYLHGCTKRTHWGTIDKMVVMQHAADRLFAAERK